MAAEQKARATYEHLMNLTNDPDIIAPLSYLRQREIVHYIVFVIYYTCTVSLFTLTESPSTILFVGIKYINMLLFFKKRSAPKTGCNVFFGTK